MLKYNTERSNLNLDKDRSCRRGRECTRESINPIQENLIKDTKISAIKNGLNISQGTFNRITKSDLKWHLYKMHVKK